MASPPAKTDSFRHYAQMVSACWRYAGTQRRKMVTFYLMYLVANIFMMFQPWIVGQVVNTLQLGGPDLLRHSFWWLLAYAGIMIGFWAIHGPARIMETNLAIEVRAGFQRWIYHRLTRLPLSWHNDYHSGGIVNRVNKAAAALSMFATTQFVYVEMVVRYTVTMVMLAWLSWPVALLLFIFSVSLFATLSMFDKRIMGYLHQSNEKEHVFSALLQDYIGNISSVIAFTLDRISKGKLAEAQENAFPFLRRQFRLTEYKWGLLACGCAVFYFVVLFLYIFLQLRQGNILMLGTLVAIFQYIMRLDMMFVLVARYQQTLAQQATDLQSIQPIEEDYKLYGIEDDHFESLTVMTGKIDFSAVGFAYPSGKKVFDGLTLTIQPGEKIGIVGPSGVGKTTLIQLLLRFYQPQHGHIKIDGQDTQLFSTESLRRNIAIIPQDTSLFETSVAENIHVARIEASQDDIAAAAKLAGAHDFIMQLPNGYDTLVGERGVKLSGGQRQRIAIARAFLKAAPILVLDEATSALDSETERHIKDALTKVMAGRTTLVIAHRLSTLRYMDRIIVLGKDGIVEQGTHDELLVQSGHYAQMWSMQAGGFLSDLTHMEE